MTAPVTAYAVATIRPWNVDEFHRRQADLPGDWHLIDDPAALSVEKLREMKPRYVFFPHWSLIVSQQITSSFECVCFHMTDVPYGRGGSPLQNLIVRGHESTVLTALRMNEEPDAGPVYFKRPLSLAGSAGEIFRRAAALTFDMIAEIVASEPKAVPQSGEPTVFARRTPAQSAIPGGGDCKELYDHIRMLDADGYPHAFLDHGDWRLEFTEARHDRGAGQVEARVVMRKREHS